MELPTSTLEEWLVELKTYQKTSIEQLVVLHGEEEAAKVWLSANGPANTATFGGEKNTEPFWDRFREEFRKFVCGHESYAKFHEQLGGQAPIVKVIYISAISAALGATLGFTATLLAPAVAIMLHLVSQIGLNAYCNAG